VNLDAGDGRGERAGVCGEPAREELDNLHQTQVSDAGGYRTEGQQLTLPTF